jgi:hypothetical protein
MAGQMSGAHPSSGGAWGGSAAQMPGAHGGGGSAAQMPGAHGGGAAGQSMSPHPSTAAPGMGRPAPAPVQSSSAPRRGTNKK